MKIHFFLSTFILITSLGAIQQELPKDMQKIMNQPKYENALWGLYVKDLETGEELYDLNAHLMFSPASTTKLFSTAALLSVYGDDYRFITPIFATGPILNGELQGDLVLVAQGDLTMGGRQSSLNKISFTKMDHIIANNIPGAILTPEDPLQAFQDLAKQIAQKNIKEIKGSIIIDDSLFEKIEKRGMVLSPMMVNENLIDLVVNPTEIGQPATLNWRPQVPGYHVENKVKTVAKDEKLTLEVSADATGKNIVIEGTIPLDQRDIVRTSNILDPAAFAKDALIQALQKEGIKIHSSKEHNFNKMDLNSFKNEQPVAVWTSPPLSEYVKLILKVSHNLGADLIPLLLAVKEGKKTFNEGMLLLGNFAIQDLKIPPNSFVFIDAAGGNENRLTPKGEIALLDFMYKKNAASFNDYLNALPVLGVDGSLEDFAKNTSAVGKVKAKPGTGVAFNLSTNKFFLITQALSGYIQAKNGHLLAYMIVVNNGSMPQLDDIFGIFEDVCLISSFIYDDSSKNK